MRALAEKALNHMTGIAFIAAATAAVIIVIPHAQAETGSLAGSWSGGGTVVYSSGDRERASCRAHYSRQSESSYLLNATCATPSGSVTQSATLRKSGANSFAGRFYNSQYNTSGSIYVSIHGSSQSVSLRSSAGSASLTLHR